MTDAALDSILARLQRLEDIEAIRQLKYRYFRAIDTADTRTLADCITDDISVDYAGGTYRWTISGKREFVTAIAAGFHNRAIASHNGHHPEIDITSPTTATGLWYLADSFTHLDQLVVTAGTALYRDTYVKQNGFWLIRTSSYTRIFETVEQLARPPNVTFSLLATAGRPPVNP